MLDIFYQSLEAFIADVEACDYCFEEVCRQYVECPQEDGTMGYIAKEYAN